MLQGVILNPGVSRHRIIQYSHVVGGVFLFCYVFFVVCFVFLSIY